MRKQAVFVLMLSILSGCASNRQTETARSATEELLLSSAADRAAAHIAAQMPAARKIYLDASNFDATDGKYALGEIADALVRHGDLLVDSKTAADLVIMVRSGALATDFNETLLGTPNFAAPVPLSGSINIPKIALFDKMSDRGVAKFAATAIDPKTGALVASSGAQFGYAHNTAYTVLLFISWTSQDITPKSQIDKNE